MTHLGPRDQPIGEFVPEQPELGFYIDLSGVARSYGSPRDALDWLDIVSERRTHVLPVTVLQLGLGAWQISRYDEEWLPVARAVTEWAVLDMDGHGRFPHLMPMPHTYEILSPWYSAMAQGHGVSLLVRAADTFDEDAFIRDAARAAAPLLDGSWGLIAASEHGPVLQEYPTDPPAHVLNGWMWALWGLYDATYTARDIGEETRAAASAALSAGITCLARSLPEYETMGGWSTYDRFPHPIANIASPFYHRLHVEMLRAMSELVPDEPAFGRYAERWGAALNRPALRSAAVARKVGFRLVRPRGKAA